MTPLYPHPAAGAKYRANRHDPQRLARPVSRKSETGRGTFPSDGSVLPTRCRWCNAPLVQPEGRGRPRQFCGPKCREASRGVRRHTPAGSRVVTSCRECGDTFEYVIVTTRRRYCGDCRPPRTAPRPCLHCGSPVTTPRRRLCDPCGATAAERRRQAANRRPGPRQRKRDRAG